MLGHSAAETCVTQCLLKAVGGGMGRERFEALAMMRVVAYPSGEFQGEEIIEPALLPCDELR